MDKFKEIKNKYDLIRGYLKDSSDTEELVIYIKNISYRIWGSNIFYSDDYSKAIYALTNDNISESRIKRAMKLAREDDEEMYVPDFFKKLLLDDLIHGSNRAEDMITELNDLLYCMGNINDDFTMDEAMALGKSIDPVIQYACAFGLDYSDIKIEESLITDINKSSYKNGAFSGEETDGINSKAIESDSNEKSKLSILLDELDSMIGLDNIKNDVHSLVNFLNIANLRKSRGLKAPTISYHLVFTGNPGTGKTTIARLIGRIYKEMGILPEDTFVEADRSSLVAGYVGQTAIKTKEMIDKAMGGVLFIDEAYSLASDSNDNYGKEAIETILKAMEDHRDELIIIVAGYTDEMQKFMESNPGLSSRFNKYFEFKDYNAEQLVLIFKNFCNNNGYVIDEEATKTLFGYFKELYSYRTVHFGNARTARNIFEKAINAQANRIAFYNDISNDDLMKITSEDIKSAL